jgi:hypothetical protein
MQEVQSSELLVHPRQDSEHFLHTPLSLKVLKGQVLTQFPSKSIECSSQFMQVLESEHLSQPFEHS